MTSYDNARAHQALCEEIHSLYVRKNQDYGDSFHQTWEEEWFAMARIRLSDKLSRFKQLSKGNKQLVANENIRDTLIDLANYAMMTVMEIDRLSDDYLIKKEGPKEDKELANLCHTVITIGTFRLKDDAESILCRIRERFEEQNNFIHMQDIQLICPSFTLDYNSKYRFAIFTDMSSFRIIHNEFGDYDLVCDIYE